MKNLILPVLIISVIIGIRIIGINSRYANLKDDLLEKSTNNWILVDSVTDWELFLPHTWFNPRISGIWMVKKNDCAWLDSTTIVGHIYFAAYNEEGYYGEGLEYFLAFNCTENISLYDEDPKELIRKHKDKKSWSPIESGTSGAFLHQYFCSDKFKYTMFDHFGQPFDVSNLFITGMYSTSDKNTDVFRAINNNPYIPTIEDETIIQQGITLWLSKNHPNSKVNFNQNLYLKTKYKESTGGFGMPLDIYSITIKPDSISDEIQIEFYFSKLSVPKIPNWEWENEIVVLNPDSEDF